MPDENLLIVPTKSGWSLKRERSGDFLAHYSTQAKAIDMGRAVAAILGGELYIEDERGRFRTEDGKLR